MLSALEERVLDFIRTYELLPKGEKVVVGVSGGPDSVCLLHLLWRLKEELGIELYAAHLNHMLRAEADADAQYVADLCRSINIPVFIQKRDVASFRKKHKLSWEEAARKVRYDFLSEVVLSLGGRRVVVGHTSDDKIETILMNLVRGSGLRGLRGIMPISHWGEVIIVRPLLVVKRQETEDYCQRYNLNPRLDISNLSLYFVRNRFRRKIIPLLESINPQFKASLLRTAKILSDAYSFLEKEAKQVWAEVLKEEEGGIYLDIDKFFSLHPSLQHHLLLLAGDKLGVGLEGVHIEKILASLSKRGKIINLPRGLILVVEYNRAWLGFNPPPCPFPPLEGEYKINIPGETRFSGWKVKAEVKPSPVLIERDNFKAFLDWEKVGSGLFVRTRRSGDIFQPLGMKEEKRLQDFMVDEKIPRWWRDRVPLVCSSKQIIWVVGFRIDERVKVSPETKEVLILEFEKNQKPLEESKFKSNLSKEKGAKLPKEE